VRLFKSTYTDRDGQTRATQKWYAELQIDRRARRVALFADRAASDACGKNIDRLIALRAGGESPDAAMQEWMNRLPKPILGKLEAWGLVSAARASVRAGLGGLLDQYQVHLVSKQCTPRHIKTTLERLRKIFARSRARSLADVTAQKVRTVMVALQKEGLGPKTINLYLSSGKAFFNWLHGDGRISENPLTVIAKMNQAVDVRRRRRALSTEELRWLLRTTEAGDTAYTMTGPARAMLYRLAVETGLRHNELYTLRRLSFDLDGEPATVFVAAGDSKHRRDDTLPLRPELAKALRSFLAGKLPGAEAFTGMQSDEGADMLHHDLARARVAWLRSLPRGEARKEARRSDFLREKDAAGCVVDFHGLRHAFITNLAKSGVHPKVAQELARHSSVELTMRVYTHTSRENLSEALRRLPDLDLGAGAEAARKTGTDDHSVSAACSAGFAAKPCFSLHRDASIGGDVSGESTSANSTGNAGGSGVSRGGSTKWARQGSNLRHDGYEPPSEISQPDILDSLTGSGVAVSASCSAGLAVFGPLPRPIKAGVAGVIQAGALADVQEDARGALGGAPRHRGRSLAPEGLGGRSGAATGKESSQEELGP